MMLRTTACSCGMAWHVAAPTWKRGTATRRTLFHIRPSGLLLLLLVVVVVVVVVVIGVDETMVRDLIFACWCVGVSPSRAY